ncbi:MAG: tRNA guanosine(34) transglycosylase Tgt [Candidatus Kerfeldbacteria bacterium]
MFELIKTHASGARLGLLETAHGGVQTPFFLPIATKGTVKTLTPGELDVFQQRVDPSTTPVMLSNTYHLYLKPGLDVLRNAGGLHHFAGWNNPILTDSGGFQIFSLAHLRKLTDNGVEFSSHLDGSKHMFTPEHSMEVQSVISADIWMAFDYFPGHPAKRKDAQRSVELTSAWAARCVDWKKGYDAGKQERKRNMLFGIVQGSTFDDLRRQSAAELTAMPFDGFAVGGLAVGEPPEEMYKVLDVTVSLLPENKPHYLMGVGPPEQILEAVKRGIDMFDCVIPTRNARHGTVFIRDPKGNGRLVDDSLQEVSYHKVNMNAETHKDSDTSVDGFCPCTLCAGTLTRRYLRHLLTVDEPVAARLMTEHNITFYMQLMKEIRDTIRSS